MRIVHSAPDHGFETNEHLKPFISDVAIEEAFGAVSLADRTDASPNKDEHVTWEESNGRK